MSKISSNGTSAPSSANSDLADKNKDKKFDHTSGADKNKLGTDRTSRTVR
jgi:hypothetical protein